jgi:hypothetical protein
LDNALSNGLISAYAFKGGDPDPGNYKIINAGEMIDRAMGFWVKAKQAMTLRLAK